MVVQPSDDSIHFRKLFGLGPIPSFRPSAHLPLDETLGFPQRTEPVETSIECSRTRQSMNASLTSRG